jgi:predicted transcriptional regulator
VKKLKVEIDSKDRYTNIFLTAANVEITDTKFKDYKNAWWLNLRQKKDSGLRLTDQGLDFVQKYADIKTYFIEFPTDLKVTPQILVWLDNFIKSPYHIGKKGITVLSEMDAFELYLFSGDVWKLGSNKAMSKRYAQDLDK